MASVKSNIPSDTNNIALLIFLYTLQGVPLGLTASIPLLLQNHKVSYVEQAFFSFANWPFSLKLLWAPIVDALFLSSFGRRKSWLVPTQYLIALFMYVLSSKVDVYLSDGNITQLTFVFIALNALAATQDIAVDGWALTMLRKENVGYASTCNSVGQTLGFFCGYLVFLALESAEFCNSYLRSQPLDVGIITLAGFLYFWSAVFFVSTTVVMFLKTENRESDTDEKSGIVDSYKIVLKIVQRDNLKTLLKFLLTCKIAFAASDAATALKLQESGVSKETMAMSAIPIVPIQILIPIVINKYVTGPKPMKAFMRAYPFRMIFTIIFAAVLYYTPSFKVNDTFPMSYYAMLLFLYCIQQFAVYTMFVSIMAFFAQVSDPVLGGTYMTLLNTATNLGGNWPATLSLALIDYLTFKHCSVDGDITCSDVASVKSCALKNGLCEGIDGYFVLCLVCLLFGILWLPWGFKTVRKLESLDRKAWNVKQKHRSA